MNPSLRQLAETLLWSTSDNSSPSGGEPLDRSHTVEDIDKESLELLDRRFAEFVNKAEPLIKELKGSDWSSIDEFYTGRGSGDYQTEIDYILTVNETGSGFWEADDWEPEIGAILANLARSETPFYAFSDNGKVHVESL